MSSNDHCIVPQESNHVGICRSNPWYKPQCMRGYYHSLPDVQDDDRYYAGQMTRYSPCVTGVDIVELGSSSSIENDLKHFS
eukprot:10905370-Karenia_brevis.AAC.1